MSIEIPKVFSEIFNPYRYKALYGGRGSAKSHSIAMALSLKGAQQPLRILCCREIQKSIKDSVKRLIEDKIKQAGLESFYSFTETEIRGKNGTLFIFAGLKTNPDSIKSMEGIDIAWVEEASRVSQRSLDLLIPTIRKPHSEIWFSWNPEYEDDPVDKMFRTDTPPPQSLIISVSYANNPFFPEVLRLEMEHDKVHNYDKYVHIWEGGYQRSSEGAYYAKILLSINNQITKVPYDPRILVDTFWDLGVRDAMSVWFAQRIGTAIHIIDFLEVEGEGLTYMYRELKEKGYAYGRHYAPHDIEVRELTDGKSRLDKARLLGIDFSVVPNIPVMDGIEAARDILYKCWFDEDKCRDGLKSLRHYQKEFDEKRNTFKPHPLHDWSSHAADAFRYLAVGWQEQTKATSIKFSYDDYGRPIVL